MSTIRDVWVCREGDAPGNAFPVPITMGEQGRATVKTLVRLVVQSLKLHPSNVRHVSLRHDTYPLLRNPDKMVNEALHNYQANHVLVIHGLNRGGIDYRRVAFIAAVLFIVFFLIGYDFEGSLLPHHVQYKQKQARAWLSSGFVAIHRHVTKRTQGASTTRLTSTPRCRTPSSPSSTTKTAAVASGRKRYAVVVPLVPSHGLTASAKVSPADLDVGVVDSAGALAQSLSASDKVFDLIAIVLPGTPDKILTKLRAFGYDVRERAVPVAWASLPEGWYKKTVNTSGCCGFNELVALRAFELTDYAWVLMMHPNTIALKSISPLWKAADVATPTTRVIHPPGLLPEATLSPRLLLLRPSRSTYKELVDVVREGDYRPGSGWRGSGVGYFYGGGTMNGLLPYYFVNVRKGADLRVLDGCRYSGSSASCADTKWSDLHVYQFVRCAPPYSCPGPTHGLSTVCRTAQQKWWQLLWLKQDALKLARTKQCKPGQPYDPSSLDNKRRGAAPPPPPEPEAPVAASPAPPPAEPSTKATTTEDPRDKAPGNTPMTGAKPPPLVKAEDIVLDKMYDAYSCDFDMMKLACPTGSSLVMKTARHGRKKGSHYCRDDAAHVNSDCGHDVSDMMAERCQGQRLCNQPVTAGDLKGDPCPGLAKYLHVKYSCAKN